MKDIEVKKLEWEGSNGRYYTQLLYGGLEAQYIVRKLCTTWELRLVGADFNVPVYCGDDNCFDTEGLAKHHAEWHHDNLIKSCIKEI